MAAMGIISIIIVFWLLSSVFWWSIVTSGVFVTAHGLFRDASMHKDMDDAMAMEGDFTINEESSFLGDNTGNNV